MNITSSGPPPKPRLRGVIHLLAIVPTIIATIILFLRTPELTRTAVIVYGIALVLLFSVSAFYHTPHWEPETRSKLRRLDHCMIYIFIAGTYTPFCVQLGGTSYSLLLPVVWGGAILGVLKSLFWINAPRYINAIPFVLLGWAIVPAVDDFYNVLGLKIVGLLGLGGLMYTAGAIAYARKAPNPNPLIFGYHEIFHTLVVAAAASHYAAIWMTIT